MVYMKKALADFAFTAMSFFFVTWLGGLATEIDTAFEVPSRIKLVAILVPFSCVLKLISDALGGAGNNAIEKVSAYTASPSVNDDEDVRGLISLAILLPAQAVGAALGMLAIMEVMPLQYRYMLAGPSLKVDIHTGAVVEFVLAFVHSVATLWISKKGPRKMIVQIFFATLAVVALSTAGGAYTGPAMNPAMAFGWAYVHKRHETWELFYVYWICPLIGAILAGKTFLILFPAPRAPARTRTRSRSTNKKKKACVLRNQEVLFQ